MRRILGLVFGLTSALSGGVTAADDGRYMGAFWYDQARPVESLKFQLYDLGKGEFDRAAVERWLELIRTKHPGYGTYVREIRTDPKHGTTEAERLAKAIEREQRRWAEVQRRPSRPIPRLITPSGAATRGVSPVRGSWNGPSPGSTGVPPYPAGSPFPYPLRAGPR